MKQIPVMLITLYKWFLSPLLGRNCRYTPSCSTYMQQAIKEHGITDGVVFGVKRICKCHPFSDHYYKTKGYDPVPAKSVKMKKTP